MAATKEQIRSLRHNLPIRWRIKEYGKERNFTTNKPFAICLAYSNTQDVEKHLDQVLGPENWSTEYQSVNIGGDNYIMVCRLGINVEGEGWVFKSDTGSEGVNPKASRHDKNKIMCSDAFKRASVHWGVGRYNYYMPTVYVTCDKTGNETKYPNVVDAKGNRVHNLTKYINEVEIKKIKGTLEDYAESMMEGAVDEEDARAGQTEFTLALVDGKPVEAMTEIAPEPLSAWRRRMEGLMKQATGWSWDTVNKFITTKLLLPEGTVDNITVEQRQEIEAAIQNRIAKGK